MTPVAIQRTTELCKGATREGERLSAPAHMRRHGRVLWAGDGVAHRARCSRDRIVAVTGVQQGAIMVSPRQTAVAAESPADAPRDPQTQVLLTQADFEALVNELESLRMRYRGELAGRLREARAFGGTSDNDDLLAALEEAAIDQARIARLEELVRSASVVEQPIADGGAGLGSTVRVVDDAGGTTEYRLIGRRSPDSGRYDVTMASPVGQALWGSRPGAVVRVALPNGRHRTLRVIDVSHSLLAPSANEARSAATRVA